MNFKVRFKQTNQRLKVRFNDNNKGFDVGFRDMQIATLRPDAEIYEGDYDVIPQVEAQALKTKNKFMLEDVQVLSIPCYEVGNNSGGNTVYIATTEEMLELMKQGREN